MAKKRIIVNPGSGSVGSLSSPACEARAKVKSAAISLIVERIVAELPSDGLVRRECRLARDVAIARAKAIVDRLAAEPSIRAGEILPSAIEQFVGELGIVFRARPMIQRAMVRSAWKVLVERRIPEFTEAEQAALVERLQRRVSVATCPHGCAP
jgi:hypothetical protein